MPAILEVENLTVKYNTLEEEKLALNHVSLTVEEGEALGIAGESGSGKTTLALSILRLLPSSSTLHGRIIFENRDLLTLREEELRKIRWKKISIVFQNSMNALNPVKRIVDQIAEPIVLHLNVGKAEAVERAISLLEKVGISRERGFDYPHEFSGGMRQRVLIAMALACNPTMLIADEPTTALDVITQSQIVDLLKTLKESFNLSMIVISHDIAVLAELCDRIAVMHGGEVVEVGYVDEIYSNPRHTYTKKLLAAAQNVSFVT